MAILGLLLSNVMKLGDTGLVLIWSFKGIVALVRFVNSLKVKLFFNITRLDLQN